jgi:hypothetical protein
MWIYNRAEDIPRELHDPELKSSRAGYTVCVILRIALAFLALYVSFPYKRQIFTGFASAIVGFFTYKQMINPASWKNYRRAIMLWSFVVLDMQLNAGRLSGVFILMDVAMGQQSQYIASHYI